MIVVDSAVWIDYFIGNKTEHVDILDDLLGKYPIGTSELIYTGVLKGFVLDKDFETAKKLFALLTELTMVTPAIALKSAENARKLRALKISTGNVSELMIGTYCVENDFAMLYKSRNYMHFEKHLSLQNAMNY